MAEHKCATCRHYQAAPMWKKGWCRNPLLYSPQQSHLVGADDLDCNRGMGSYWEPLESELGAYPEAEAEPEAFPTRFTPPASRTIAPAQPLASHGHSQHSSSYGATRREQTAPVARPRPRTQPRPAQPLASDSPESYSAGADERAWGDYLRRSYPVIAIILLLGAFWVWSSAQLARRGDSGANAPLATVPPNLGQVSVIVPSPTAGPAAAPVAGGAPAASGQPVPPPGVIAPGAKVVVNTAGDGARIRQGPTINATTVTAVDNGTLLTITGSSQDADGYSWWPVQGQGFSGWVAGVLIEPAP